MPGLEAGVLGMCPGDKRRVHIPSKLTGGQEFKLKDDQRCVDIDGSKGEVRG